MHNRIFVVLYKLRDEIKMLCCHYATKSADRALFYSEHACICISSMKYHTKTSNQRSGGNRVVFARLLTDTS